MQSISIDIKQTVASTTAVGEQSTSDHKKETESQRILQFQTYLAKFKHWQTIHPAHIKGKPSDPRLLSE